MNERCTHYQADNRVRCYLKAGHVGNHRVEKWDSAMFHCKKDEWCDLPQDHPGPCEFIGHPTEEMIDHPAHYGGADNVYEHIKVCDAWGLNYRLGNATKYIARAGKKSPDPIEDLKKARWYLDSEIQRLEKEQKS